MINWQSSIWFLGYLFLLGVYTISWNEIREFSKAKDHNTPIWQQEMIRAVAITLWPLTLLIGLIITVWDNAKRS